MTESYLKLYLVHDELLIARRESWLLGSALADPLRDESASAGASDYRCKLLNYSKPIE